MACGGSDQPTISNTVVASPRRGRPGHTVSAWPLTQKIRWAKEQEFCSLLVIATVALLTARCHCQGKRHKCHSMRFWRTIKPLAQAHLVVKIGQQSWQEQNKWILKWDFHPLVGASTQAAKRQTKQECNQCSCDTSLGVSVGSKPQMCFLCFCCCRWENVPHRTHNSCCWKASSACPKWCSLGVFSSSEIAYASILSEKISCIPERTDVWRCFSGSPIL